MLLETVTDPELPPLTIADLGILRGVAMVDGVIEVSITPTYSGCPAMREIGGDIERVLKDAGFGTIRVKTILTPAWTTAWLTASGRQKLVELGIAPPSDEMPIEGLFVGRPVPCPRCGSNQTETISPFGSTSCKSLHRCRACREPFEAVKCH